MSSVSTSFMPSLTVPSEPPSFEGLSPHAILAEVEDILHTTASIHDRLVATITPDSATFPNVIRPLVDNENRSACRLTIASDLLAQLSPEAEVRHAARQAQMRIQAARVQNLMRHDVAALVFAVHSRQGSEHPEKLDEEDQHLMQYMRAQYIRSGAQLRSSTERERFRQASAELDEICAAAQDTMIEPEEGLWFERAELKGIPENDLATMVPQQTHVQVTFKKHHIAAVLRHATNRNTRRRLFVADKHRLPKNIDRLSRVIVLRDEIARLLGFDNHASLKMQSRMAPSVSYVETELEELHHALKPVAQAERDHLVEYRREHPAEGGDDPTGEFCDWDKTFYAYRKKQDESSVNLSPFADYFEVTHTFHAMLNIYRELFGLIFQLTEISTWHDSVLAFQVWNTPSEGGSFVGHLYADLYEREGKYRGAHCIGIRSSFVEKDGTRHYPVTALVCCYAKSSISAPTLLQHKEVTTMFHELGHAIHNLVSKTKYALPRSRDFSEIPSNMLESWTWVPDVLIRIGRHYTAIAEKRIDTGALPRDLAEAVCATRNISRAGSMLGQVWPALFDLTIHTPPTHQAALEMDTTKIWNETKQRVSVTNCGPDAHDSGAGQARFIHMFRHNDVGYFSYPLSIAYAADLFADAFARDPMDPAAGRRWRYEVLQPGSSRPEMHILRDFLGREPSIKAIIDEIVPKAV